MTATNYPPSPAEAKEWDHLRTAFASSLMADTPLASLAQNLEGLEWPFPGPDETPAAYLPFNYEDLRLGFAARGHPEATMRLLQILRETLAFDQPFGEMVQQSAAAFARENPLLRSLARLEIPEDFPLDLVVLDDTSRELCQLEQLETLGEYALFAQNLAQSVVVGGELRRLLNALVQLDGGVLAELLPFRPGAAGLHLAEALVHAARGRNATAQTARTLEWFEREFAEWRRAAAVDRKFLARQFARFDDPVLDEKISRLLAPHLPKPPRGSFFARWFGR